MTPDNRALWGLVEKWRERYAKELKKTVRHPFDAVEYKICADELAAILERPVVVGDSPTPFAWVYRYRAGDYSTRIFFSSPDQDEIDAHLTSGGDIVPLYLPSEKTS